MGLRKCSKNLPIRFKLLLSYFIVLAVSLFLGSVLTQMIVEGIITRNIESEPQNTTDAIFDMVKTTADGSLKNHLRVVAAPESMAQ